MSSSAPRTPVESARIVDVAIEIADADGLPGMTMRRIAERLGVTPMALYKHLPGREPVIDAMVDRIVAEFASPPESASWRESVRTRILAARTVIAQHPWAQSAIETRAVASPVVLAHIDALMAAMFAGGLTADLVHHTMHALSTRMWGFTRDVMPMPQVPGDAAQRDAAMADYARLYPAIIRMATTSPQASAGCDDAAEFVFALDILLDGVDALRASEWRSSAN